MVPYPLCLYLEEVLQSYTKLGLENLELITKWGCDGSHQAPFQQDAKVWNAAISTSSTWRSHICGKTTKDFNNFDNTDVEDSQSLRFGLSTLHARIRLLETVISGI